MVENSEAPGESASYMKTMTENIHFFFIFYLFPTYLNPKSRRPSTFFRVDIAAHVARIIERQRCRPMPTKYLTKKALLAT